MLLYGACIMMYVIIKNVSISNNIYIILLAKYHYIICTQISIYSDSTLSSASFIRTKIVPLFLCPLPLPFENKSKSTRNSYIDTHPPPPSSLYTVGKLSPFSSTLLDSVRTRDYNILLPLPLPFRFTDSDSVSAFTL